MFTIAYRTEDDTNVFEVKPTFSVNPLNASCTENTVYPLPELKDNKGNLRLFTVGFDNITA